MRITILINGKKHERELPTSWAQVNFETFLKLQPVQGDFMKTFAVLVDLDPEDLRKAQIHNLESVLPLLSFIDRPIELQVPEMICGFTIPKNLGLQSLGQYADLKNAIERSIKEKKGLETYPLYCAIYACPYTRSERDYDWVTAEEMAPKFLKAPALEVLAVGNFTVTRYVGWMKGLTDASPEPSTPSKNDKPALKSSPKPTGSTARSSTSKGKRRSTGKKS